MRDDLFDLGFCFRLVTFCILHYLLRFVYTDRIYIYVIYPWAFSAASVIVSISFFLPFFFRLLIGRVYTI